MAPTPPNYSRFRLCASVLPLAAFLFVVAASPLLHPALHDSLASHTHRSQWIHHPAADAAPGSHQEHRSADDLSPQPEDRACSICSFLAHLKAFATEGSVEIQACQPQPEAVFSEFSLIEPCKEFDPADPRAPPAPQA